MLPARCGVFGCRRKRDSAWCPPHLQFLYNADGPIGRTIPCLSQSAIREMVVPTGQATIIASSFVDPLAWWQCKDYDAMKRKYTEEAIARLGQFFHLTPDTIRHQEAATPRTFAVIQLVIRALLAALVNEYPLSVPMVLPIAPPLSTCG